VVLTIAEALALAWYLIHPYDERNLYLYLISGGHPGSASAAWSIWREGEKGREGEGGRGREREGGRRGESQLPMYLSMLILRPERTRRPIRAHAEGCRCRCRRPPCAAILFLGGCSLFSRTAVVEVVL
jgi:hypothetical protein